MGGSAPPARDVPSSLVLGFAVASIGGPLALTSLVPSVVGSGIRSVGLVTLLGAALFGLPILLWARYSEQVSSSAGLFAFVEQAAGRKLAWVQGSVWATSYWLYLAYTVVFVVYDQLPPVVPGVVPYRPVLVVILAVAIVVSMWLRLRVLVGVLAVVAALQLALVVALGGLGLAHLGTPMAPFVPHHQPPGTLGRGAAQVSLLFVCASLVLFLGGNPDGRGVTLRRGLVGAYGLVAAGLVLSSLALAAAPAGIRDTPIPGYALAQLVGDRPLALAVGLGTAASTVALTVAEFVALARLAQAVLGRSRSEVLAGISVPFLIAVGFGLIDPEAFYRDLLQVSLVALFVSQLIVVAVYPRFRLRHRRLGATDILATVGSLGLFGYGLYTAAGSYLHLGP